MRNHVYPTFGDRPVASIRPSEIQAWSRTVHRCSPCPRSG
ncbi:hypothetical protein [Streptomyces cinnamoneus]|nr:hypothetical protein [Streptomyces cinnamoneus]